MQALTAFGSAAILLAASATSHAAVSGQWDFESGNLTATAGGKPLEYADGAGAETQAATRFGTTTSFGIPDIGGTEAKVMKFGTNTIPAGYFLPAPTVANGGGGQVNQWTLLLDVLYPAESNSRWRALIECDGGLTPDAEAFVNTGNALGIGSYGGSVSPGAWHRLAIVADAPADTLRFYVDGVQVLSNAGGSTAVDGRWALQTAGDALFADDNGETAGGYVNSIQLHNVALTKGQVLALGGPAAAGLPATLPPVPSSVENWIPAGAMASRTTPIGAVINPGDTTIQDSSISLTLDGTAVASPAITRPSGLIRVEKTNPGLSLGKHQLVLAYTDSQVRTTALHQPIRRRPVLRGLRNGRPDATRTKASPTTRPGPMTRRRAGRPTTPSSSRRSSATRIRTATVTATRMPTESPNGPAGASPTAIGLRPPGIRTAPSSSSAPATWPSPIPTSGRRQPRRVAVQQRHDLAGDLDQKASPPTPSRSRSTPPGAPKARTTPTSTGIRN